MTTTYFTDEQMGNKWQTWDQSVTFMSMSKNCSNTLRVWVTGSTLLVEDCDHKQHTKALSQTADSTRNDWSKFYSYNWSNISGYMLLSDPALNCTLSLIQWWLGRLKWFLWFKFDQRLGTYYTLLLQFHTFNSSPLLNKWKGTIKVTEFGEHYLTQVPRPVWWS
jgi:hypothetical protein